MKSKTEKHVDDAAGRLADAEAKVAGLKDRLTQAEADATTADAARQDAGRQAVNDPAAGVRNIRRSVAAAAIAATLADGLRAAIRAAEAEVSLRRADLDAANHRADEDRLADLAEARIAAAARLDAARIELEAAAAAFVDAGKAIVQSGLPLCNATADYLGKDFFRVFNAVPQAIRAHAVDQRGLIGDPCREAESDEKQFWALPGLLSVPKPATALALAPSPSTAIRIVVGQDVPELAPGQPGLVRRIA